MVIFLESVILSFVMADSFQPQDMLSYEKQDDLGDRNMSMDSKDTDSRPTTPDPVPPSEGGLRAWSVVLGV